MTCSAQESSSDLDTIRVSNSRLHGESGLADQEHLARLKIAEEVSSRSGKQLVPLNVQRQQSSQKSDNSPATNRGRPKQSARVRSGAPSSTQQPIRRQAQPPLSKCRGYSLTEFKSVSLDLNEIVVRDIEEQPIYLLSIRGYIRLSDGLFLPLAGFRDRLHVIKATLGPVSERPLMRPPLNCTFSYAGIDTGGAASEGLSLSQRGNRPFREEITIFFDCGYLVLQTSGDSNYLELESLSLYRISDELSSKSFRERLTTIPRKQSQQVFKGDLAPLLVMPQMARYTCKNRIALTDANSSVLVLDQIEFFRLPVATAYGSFVVASVSPSTSVGQQRNSQPDDAVEQPDLPQLADQSEKSKQEQSSPAPQARSGSEPSQRAEDYSGRLRRSAPLIVAGQRSLGE